LRGDRLALGCIKLFKPVREGKCEIIARETLEEAAFNLAQKLREARVL